jgi:hypothetical protein
MLSLGPEQAPKPWSTAGAWLECALRGRCTATGGCRGYPIAVADGASETTTALPVVRRRGTARDVRCARDQHREPPLELPSTGRRLTSHHSSGHGGSRWRSTRNSPSTLARRQRRSPSAACSRPGTSPVRPFPPPPSSFRAAAAPAPGWGVQRGATVPSDTPAPARGCTSSRQRRIMRIEPRRRSRDTHSQSCTSVGCGCIVRVCRPLYANPLNTGTRVERRGGGGCGGGARQAAHHVH